MTRIALVSCAKKKRQERAPARDLVALANETLAGDPQAGEHARGMNMKQMRFGTAPSQRPTR